MRRPALAVTMAAAIAAAALGVIPLGAIGQQGAAPVDPDVLQQGAEDFSDKCSECHQANGVGMPPDFPALAGNENLRDLTLVVGNVHNGKNAMPAFSHLGAEEIAAVATYVRNAWGNSFGGTSADEVASIVAALPAAGDAAAGMTIWDGVFTEEQVARAETVYMRSCARCHGLKLDGVGGSDQPSAPASARAGFLKYWYGQTLQPLHEYIRTKMPHDNPGQLTDQQASDVLAYMLSMSGAEPGDAELPANPGALANVAITEQAE